MSSTCLECFMILICLRKLFPLEDISKEKVEEKPKRNFNKRKALARASTKKKKKINMR